MHLYLIRHGVAADSSPSGRDEDRELTKEGSEKMRRAARAIAALVSEEKRLSVFSSPLVRAVQTAQLVLPELPGKPALKEIPHLKPESPVQALIDFLAASGCESALLFGHEPLLSSVIGELIGASPVAVEMKKGAMSHLEVLRWKKGGAVLRWHLCNRHLREMAKS